MDINLTLLVELIFFLAFLWLTRRYIWPHFIQALESRQAIIDEGIRKADKAESILREAQEQALLRQAQSLQQEQAILDRADKQATLLLQKAKKEAKELQQQWQDQAMQSMLVAREEIMRSARKELLAVSQQVLERVLADQLGDKKAQKVLLERYLQDAESS